MRGCPECVRTPRSTPVVVVLAALCLLAGSAAYADRLPIEPKPDATSRERALVWLANAQDCDGSWGGEYRVAVTGLSCLAYLASNDKPLEGEKAAPLVSGLAYLLTRQTNGVFPKEGHTWIHGQGFATLALAEAYGRTLLDGSKPDIDLAKIREALTKAVVAIQTHQSTSGGWWYVQGSPGAHEGSTTVCAVQALVAAANYGIETDAKVLARGFEYLKRCQNPDGGFDYKEGPGTVSMKEGTAGGVATLALMRKFDYEVMTSGVDFLERIGPGAISKERFPYYGHFYASMGLTLFGEEMGAEDRAKKYVQAAAKGLNAWQAEDGSWPLKGWMAGKSGDAPYGTAFALMVLSVPDRRLSIFHRRPPELPKTETGAADAGD